MNIYEAANRAAKENLWLRKRDRTEEWTLHVAGGSVFRRDNGAQVDLDARDVMKDDWYLINDEGVEVP